MDNIEAYLDANRLRNQDDLFELLRMASVSTDSQYQADVQRAGQWVADQFRSLGFMTEIVETKGHPIVYAETPPVQGAPLVLVYGHYDVQRANAHAYQKCSGMDGNRGFSASSNQICD